MRKKGICFKNFVFVSFVTYCWKIYKVRRDLIRQCNRHHKVQQLLQKTTVQPILDQRFSHIKSSHMIWIVIQFPRLFMNCLVLDWCKTNIMMSQMLNLPLTGSFLGSHHPIHFQAITRSSSQLIKRSSHQRCSIKGVLKFLGRHLCQSPFFKKVSFY